jgi:glycosyltransferase involved in cell wall biosynthesis
MKILLVSTSDRIGGAAIACNRIFNALKRNGTEVKMLVRDKVSNDPDIYTLNTNIFWKFLNYMSFCLERLCILFKLKFKKQNLFQVSFDNIGAANLLNHPLVREAEVINFHWTSQGMLSLKQLQKLMDAGKHIVFTMHDMHYFTGICHYARTCKNYEKGCGSCFFLNNSHNPEDFSKRWYTKKLNMEHRQNLIFVACSNWLKDIAKTSAMFTKTQVISIPNPIDTNIFKQTSKDAARAKFGLTKKKVILFGAANINDKRKGFEYLLSALKYIHTQHPEYDNEIELLIFGQGDKKILSTLPYSYKMAGYIKSEKDIVNLYSAADVFVTPSLEDNLPNTVMEALSCSTPCVAFNTGGLPQLIDNDINGYLAKYKDFTDFAKGILKIVNSNDYDNLCHNARAKVEENFSEPVIAMKYNEIYRMASI